MKTTTTGGHFSISEQKYAPQLNSVNRIRLR